MMKRKDWRRMLRRGLIGGLIACAFALSAGAQVDMLALLHAAENAQTARAMDRALFDPSLLNREDPMWPVYAFLLGEIARLRGESGDARQQYRAVAEWAAADPYHDTWGGSGLGIASLWRWAQSLANEPSPPAEDVAAILALAAQLREMRCARYMFHLPLSIISTFPQIEEELAHLLAMLANAAGTKAQAEQLFLHYLSVARTPDLSERETALLNQLITSGLASPDRLALLRGKRLLSLKLYPEAERFLTNAAASDDLQIQAEARLYLARLRRYTGASREEIAALLDGALLDAEKPDVIRMALLERAIIWNREGKGRNPQQFVADLTRLIDEFPDSDLTDDALYHVARYYEYAADVPNAVKYYARLRKFEGENDWSESAVFRPALLLYGRGASGDFDDAAALLRQFETKDAGSPFHLLALFWLGRIAEERGDAAGAAAYFQRLLREAPLDYYGIRAQMHLELGRAAKAQLWPDAARKSALADAYRRSTQPDDIAPASPYHARLRIALNTGLYAAAFSADRRLRERFPSQRQDMIPLAELDGAGLLTPLCLLLALRQDAMAARDRAADAETLLRVAWAAGNAAEDWPLAMEFVMRGEDVLNLKGAAQQSPCYFRTAYPALFRGEIAAAARKFQVAPELLYSMMRRESFFYPAAFSPRGALGLFQFIPNTFAKLDQRWKLLENSGTASKEAFLMTPAFSIDLGARWCRDELLKRYPASKFGEAALPLALMDHNAGYPAVREWLARWTQEGRAADLEYMLDTARFGETRIFVRHVLADMIIVDAIGLLRESRH